MEALRVYFGYPVARQFFNGVLGSIDCAQMESSDYTQLPIAALPSSAQRWQQVHPRGTFDVLLRKITPELR